MWDGRGKGGLGTWLHPWCGACALIPSLRPAFDGGDVSGLGRKPLSKTCPCVPTRCWLWSVQVGLVLLPVVLSILAPPPVRSALADGVGGGSTATPHQAAAGGLRTGQEPRRVEGERGEGDGGNLKDAAEEGGAGAVVGAPAV